MPRYDEETRKIIDEARESEKEANRLARELELQTTALERQMEKDQRREENRARHQAERSKLKQEAIIRRTLATKAAAEMIEEALSTIEPDVSTKEQVQQFCSALAMDAIQGIVTVACNPMELGSTRLSAYERMMKWAVGEPTEKLKRIPEQLSLMPNRDAINVVIENVQLGIWTEEQGASMTKLLQARESSELDQLRNELAELRGLLTGTNGQTINEVPYHSSGAEH